MTRLESLIDLKPCPFCGGEASVVQYVGDLYVVACDYCFVRTSKYSEKEKAISVWNRRKAPKIIRCGECAKQYKPTCPFGVWINTPDDGHCHWAERRTDGKTT